MFAYVGLPQNLKDPKNGHATLHGNDSSEAPPNPSDFGHNPRDSTMAEHVSSLLFWEASLSELQMRSLCRVSVGRHCLWGKRR